jgi:lipopolysaccharide transport system ATP-binding protein
MSAVISVENISKQYRLGEVGTGTLSHDVNRWWHKVRGKEDPYLKIGESNDRSKKGESEYSWALRDVSFEVKQGEVLGIIGRNGAGKSTLLKILSRVTTPTTGKIKVKGRIASLLEVGTGFHPELTGRENIFLNGAILGMRKAEIARKLDEIIDFSGCERYIDTPVKRYSSGMYVRLAFAVAAHLESEILIVDEVLAVGDAEFQKKCLGKMKDVAGHGRTILFVSHNMIALRSLCQTGLLLSCGESLGLGEAGRMIDTYHGMNTQRLTEVSWPGKEDAPQDDLFRLHRIRVYGGAGDSDVITIDKEVCIEIDYELFNDHPHVSVSTHVFAQGTCAFVTGNPGAPQDSGLHRIRFLIPGNLLNAENYSVTVFMIASATQLRLILPEVLTFEALEPSRESDYQGRVIGAVRPLIPWLVERLHTHKQVS